ncbi:RES family NAD+ phosphorylase [Empedobacter falsenii]|uniref:RES family NAD+ phosphorylase n=1 Tax=Empedobacter falsenii TaxID=343874 RepID=UPI002576C618|nr:RES family NAD+ phosphorylase [Empedobacter falsenii]MDM1299770.1 RES family NAD+ phosphorylase [Empedobacter falsenii]MDM1319563.1 RES family NAD+ phosphorylase [Empedobacter falsenii]
MFVYRIEREKYLDDTLKGIGASKTKSSRWNSEYQRMVYTAGSISLACLEVLVHLGNIQTLPSDRLLVRIVIPDDIIKSCITLDVNNLPVGWNNKPPSEISQLIGDEFLHLEESAVLKVPSSIIPNESNYLINPLHQDAKLITVSAFEPFNFDERFLSLLV